MTLINPLRGEALLTIDGQDIVLRLTLGSLAALEQAFGVDGLRALGERLLKGRMSTDDILKVLSAGLLGAGHAISPDVLGRKLPASSLEQAASAASRLLAATFGGGAPPSLPPPPQAT